MRMICWLRRTGATTWRSLPPLQMIIAIIIVMFYSIFFCCSIWTLIRVCVGHNALPFHIHLHSPSHGPKVSLPSGVRRPLLIRSPAPSTVGKIKIWGNLLREGGGGFKEILYQCSRLSRLGFGTSGFVLVPFVIVYFFWPSLTLGFLVLLGCVATYLPLGINRHLFPPNGQKLQDLLKAGFIYREDWECSGFLRHFRAWQMLPLQIKTHS